MWPSRVPAERGGRLEKSRQLYQGPYHRSHCTSDRQSAWTGEGGNSSRLPPPTHCHPRCSSAGDNEFQLLKSGGGGLMKAAHLRGGDGRRGERFDPEWAD